MLACYGPVGGMGMEGLLQLILTYPVGVAVVTVFLAIVSLVLCLVTWSAVRRRSSGEPLPMPQPFHVAPPIDPRERVHSQLLEFVKLASGTLLQDQVTTPEMIVEKLLELARADVRYRGVYVGYAFRFARQHTLGTSYFTRCSKDVLEEAIIANLGFLHEWGHDGNVIVEHGLRREQAQILRAAEPA